MELAIPHPTTKSFFASDDVVDLQLKKTTACLELKVDVRSGVERQAMLLQPDAQQVRARQSRKTADLVKIVTINQIHTT